MSRTSLFKVLNLLKPSQRHSLAGLDNRMVAGTGGLEGWNRLCDKMFKDDKDILADIKTVQRYLKSSFVAKCNQTSKVASHCTAFGLSDPKNDHFSETCDHEHTEICSSCAKIFQLFQMIWDKISTEKDPNTKSEMMYDYDQSKKAILKWQQQPRIMLRVQKT